MKWKIHLKLLMEKLSEMMKKAKLEQIEKISGWIMT